MGSDYQTSGAGNPTDVLDWFNKNLFGLQDQVNQTIPETALSQLRAANIMTGRQFDDNALGINALNLDQLRQYGLPEAEAGQAIARSNALAGAATNRDQLLGAGGGTARVASALNRSLNPEFYAAEKAGLNELGSADRTLTSAESGANANSRAASDIVDSINLNGLSPGEASAVERSLNQTNTASGNLGLLNPTNTINNAINFGNAFNQKVGLKEAALGTAIGANNALTNIGGARTGIVGAASGLGSVASTNGGFNPVSIALGQPNVSTASNFGTGQFANTANMGQAPSSNAFNFGGNVLNALTSGNNAAQSAGASMANATSPASYLASVCCFIFLEAYHGKLPKCVRRGRDGYYRVNHDIATGYRRTARYLVPLMKQFWFIRQLVWYGMVQPITEHLEHPRKGWRKILTHSWLRLWAMLGRGKDESSYAIKWEYQHV